MLTATLQAWSKIIHTLIPNVGDLEKQLNQFARLNSAQEVVIFEKTTFLVICKSNIGEVDDGNLSDERRKEIELDEEGYPPLEVKSGIPQDSQGGLYPGRFGKISQQVKELRLSCQWVIPVETRKEDWFIHPPTSSSQKAAVLVPISRIASGVWLFRLSRRAHSKHLHHGSQCRFRSR